jgi:hypothetical protein
MAARKYNRYEKYYTDGSAARQLQVVEQDQDISNVLVRRKLKRKKKSFIGYKLFMVATIMATLFVCVVYLKAENNISQQKKVIATLEKEFKDLQHKNALQEENLNRDIDLEDVYVIATEELGMIQPSAEQVKFFDNEASSFMQQVAPIAVVEKKETNHLANIIGFVSQGW